MTYTVTADWVQANEVVLVDVRFTLQDEKAGWEAYKTAHLPNAFYLDLNQDLSGDAQKHGGNHPLPNIEEFAEKLGSLGISEQTPVVFYDKGGDMYAARAWWLLHYLGHEAVYVLDGGYEAWIEAGYDVTSVIPQARATTFTPHVAVNGTVTMEDVRSRSCATGTIVIDSRAPERYSGEVEPLYNKKGHIPGAKNYFFQEVFDGNGKYKTKEALSQQFAGLDKSAEVIVSCGSGVSACPNILALKTVGFTNVKLYVGSFSDWISYDDNALECGDGSD